MTLYPITAAEQLQQMLRAQTVCVGAAVSLLEPAIVEIICGAGYDFLWIDTEHSAIDHPALNNHIRAAAITQTPVIVRIPWAHPGRVKAVLDMGAAGILFPLSKTVADVEAAIAACRYPPAGNRGYGPLRANAYERRAADYLARANDALHVWIQIEQIELVEQFDAVVQVEGISAFYMGWNDLAASMGLPGQRNHPDVIAAGNTAIDKAIAAGIPVIMGAPGDEARFAEMVAKGVTAFTGGGDVAFIAQMATAREAYVRKFVDEHVKS